MSLINMAGKRYGDLTVTRRAGTAGSRDALWRYRCNCGNEHEATGYSIRSGKIKSCPECAKKRTALASVTHGGTDSAEYRTWTDMKTRCLNPKSTGYERYGGRGVKICPRWILSFESFLEDMGIKPSPHHSIDRIDNDKGYEPSNCRWATNEEQIRNRGNTVFVTINGEQKTLVEWCEVYDCKPSAAYQRRAQGLDGESIFKVKAMVLSFNGITDTIRGWSIRTGIRPNTLSMRVNKYGWSVDRALTEGVKQCA